MRESRIAGLAVAIFATTASAGDIQVILTPTTPGPYAPNANVTVCVSLVTFDVDDAGPLTDVIGVQIDRSIVNGTFVGNPTVPSTGNCSLGAPTIGGAVFTTGTTTVWVNPTVGPDHVTLFSLTPGTPRNIFRIVARITSFSPATVDVVGPCDPNVDIGASVIALDGTTWDNCNPNAHGSIVGNPLVLAPPEPASLGFVLPAALWLGARRRRTRRCLA